MTRCVFFGFLFFFFCFLSEPFNLIGNKINTQRRRKGQDLHSLNCASPRGGYKWQTPPPHRPSSDFSTSSYSGDAKPFYNILSVPQVPSYNSTWVVTTTEGTPCTH